MPFKASSSVKCQEASPRSTRQKWTTSAPSFWSTELSHRLNLLRLMMTLNKMMMMKTLVSMIFVKLIVINRNPMDMDEYMK